MSERKCSHGQFVLQVHNVIRPLLLELVNHAVMPLRGLRKLSYLVKLFPGSFRGALCDQLISHLRKLFDMILTGYRNGEIKGT